MPDGAGDTGSWRFGTVLEIAFMPTQFVSYTGTITVTDNVPESGSMPDDQSFRHGRRGAFRYGDRLRNCHEFASGDQLPDHLLGRVRGKQPDHFERGS